MIKKYLIFWIVILITISANIYGQDAVFSQFYNSTLYLNPALAGTEDDLTLSMSHRSQWQNLQFPYNTSQLSVIIPYYQSKHLRPFGHIGGIGISIYNDEAGEDKNFKTTGVNSAFAYNLPLDAKHINQVTFGLQVGIINKRIDQTNLQWGEQYSPFVGFDASITPSESSRLENTTFFDVNFGMFYWFNPIQDNNPLIKSLNSGLTVSHLNNPNESMLGEEDIRLPLLYKYHGGIIFNLSRKANMSLNVLSAIQDELVQNNFGAYLSYRLFTINQQKLDYVIARLGTWYRVEDSFILITEFETQLFKLGFSYDWNTSSLRYNNRGIGTYEIHLSMRFGKQAPAKSRY